jgi:competence protein ComEC
MRLICLLASFFFGLIQSLPAQIPANSSTLDAYFIDVEGGQATLLVTPAHQSILIDTGWDGFNGRDAARIAESASSAGLDHIDYVLITHYHRDHVGGIFQLADRMHIGAFVDHGPNVESEEQTKTDYARYLKLIGHAQHLILHPDQGIPLTGISFRVLSSAADLITNPLPGAGMANPYCSPGLSAPTDASENAQSLGVLVTYGKFRLIDLGDLTKKKELALSCPNHFIGAVDLFVVTHHGSDQSNSKPMVWGLHPRVSVMDNGPEKGASPSAWDIVHTSPGLQDLWQLHYAIGSDKDHNVAPDFIANLDANCQGKYLKVSASSDGTFTVLNSRNGFKKTYSK